MPSYVQAILSPDPLYLQTKSYDARSDRKWFSDIRSPGVISTGDFVTTVSTGMGISIAAGVAWVLGQNIADQGTYRVYTAGASALTVTAANPTNPRLDQVILRVLDNAADSGGSNEARIELVPGTPTAGATLTNRSGAANLTTLLEASKSVLLLADVLVPAAAVSLNAGNLADKRVFSGPNIPNNTIGVAKLASPPICVIRKNVDQSVPNGGALVTYETTSKDTDTMADLANERIVIKTAGYYFVIASLAWSDHVDTFQRAALLRVNGADLGTGNYQSGFGNGFSGQVTTTQAYVQLNVNDTLTVYANQNTGVALTLWGQQANQYQTYLSALRVAA